MAPSSISTTFSERQSEDVERLSDGVERLSDGVERLSDGVKRLRLAHDVRRLSRGSRSGSSGTIGRLAGKGKDDGSNREIVNPDDDEGGDSGGVSTSRAQRNWMMASNLACSLQNASVAVRKVKLENKIGTMVADLDEGDPLSCISLAVQRALRSLNRREEEGKRGAKEPLLGGSGAHRKAEFKAASKGAARAQDAEGQSFSTYQPAFSCVEMFHADFAQIRKSFGISRTQFYAVLELQSDAVTSSYYVIGSGDASGRSHSFFFLSPDQRYILKSCTKRDVETLVRILPSYRGHVGRCASSEEGRPNSSLLPRYIGLYELKFRDRRIPDVALVVMTNFFAGTHRIHTRFDLKGSTHGREASERERGKDNPVFKDLDWIREGRRLSFPSKREADSVRRRLERDTLYLTECNLIDYSLLVGVHDIGRESANSRRWRREPMDVITCTSPSELQYVGIIDVLTPYTWRKSAETFLLGTLLCRPGISCQPAREYQRRFMSFMDEMVLSVAEGVWREHSLPDTNRKYYSNGARIRWTRPPEFRGGSSSPPADDDIPEYAGEQ